MIDVKIVQKGMIFLLNDRNPTRDIPAHNYVVLSDVNEFTKTILCYTITSCKRGNYKKVIPIKCTNGNICYINPFKTFRFTIDDFMQGTYHGVLDKNTSMLLSQIYMLQHGLINSDELKEKISNEWAKISTDINNTEMNKMTDNKVIEKKSMNSEYTNATEIKRNLPRFVSDWTDSELSIVFDMFRGKDFDEVKRLCNLNSNTSVYHKANTIKKELVKRGLIRFV